MQAYLEQFQNAVDVIGYSGGSIGHDPGIKKAVADEKGYEYDTMSETNKKEVEKEAQGRYLAVAFVLGGDRQRYGRLIENMENDYLQGQNNYPSTITTAYNLLTNWKQDPRNLVRTIGPVNDGVSFANIAVVRKATMLMNVKNSVSLVRPC